MHRRRLILVQSRRCLPIRLCLAVFLTRRRKYFQDESLPPARFSFSLSSLYSFFRSRCLSCGRFSDVQSRLSHRGENLPVISQLRVKAELLDSSAQQTFAALSWTKVLISFQILGSLPIRPPARPPSHPVGARRHC